MLLLIRGVSLNVFRIIRDYLALNYIGMIFATFKIIRIKREFELSGLRVTQVGLHHVQIMYTFITFSCKLNFVLLLFEYGLKLRKET